MIKWILQIHHVLWGWILKMKVNNLFFTWQGREPNRKEVERFEKVKNHGRRKMTFAFWKNMNRVGIGSLIREGCTKCVTFMNEMYALAPQPSKGDFRGSNLVWVARGIFIVRWDWQMLSSGFPRCEVGLENWVQCNDAPVKVCKYPVTGLQEGRSYIFRVRAVNTAGISRPSRASEPVAALDPVDLERTQSRLFKAS